MRTEEYLRDHTAARVSLVPGLGHGVSKEVLAEVREFLIQLEVVAPAEE